MDELLRFHGAAPHDPQIAAWFAADDPLRQATRLWFDQMRGAGDDVLEAFHDGRPVVCIGDAPFAYVAAFKAHASVGFFQGATLPDPAGLLEGDGKRMRHVKLRPGKELDWDALEQLIEAAYQDMQRRLNR